MVKIIPWLSFVGLCLGACSASPTPTLVPAEHLSVDVVSVDVLQLESYPVQLMLHVSGWLPNPCAVLDWTVTPPQEPGGEIEVELFALPGPEQACIQVLAPFEVNIPLGPQPEGDVAIELNGEAVMPGATQ
jgi:hypothetical protein